MLSHYERIQKLIAGEITDVPAVAAWRHFPEREQQPLDLVNATLEFQKYYDCDFVKLTPSGMYSVEGYGVTSSAASAINGARARLSSRYESQESWRQLPSQEFDDGALCNALEVAAGVRSQLPDSTPILATIFSPLTMANKMASTKVVARLLDDDVLADRVLDRLADDVVTFATAALDLGVDGFFFACQQASRETPDNVGQYEHFGSPYDLAILDAIRDRAEFLLLHLHGNNPNISLADSYPVDLVSWEDRETVPSLSGGIAETNRVVCGGIDRLALGRSDAAAIYNDVADVFAKVPNCRAVVAPGCVLLQNTAWPELRNAFGLIRANLITNS